MSEGIDVASVFTRLEHGDRRALARAISTVEDRRDGAADLVMAAFSAASGRIIGVTGAPGSGKSTLVDALVEHLRRADRRVAVVAVDPASPFTGGAILGDRIRMQRHVDDRQVFVRSMSNRGHLGGLASTTAQVATLLAVGHDPVIVETVGVGQSEVEIVDLAHVTLVVQAPGFGDGVQVAKAGVLEIGDVYVVNKSDLPGADALVRDLTQVTKHAHGMAIPVVETVASAGEGIGTLWAEVDSILERWSPGDDADRATRLVRAAVRDQLAARVRDVPLAAELIDAVVARRQDPWTAAAELVASVRS